MAAKKKTPAKKKAPAKRTQKKRTPKFPDSFGTGRPPIFRDPDALATKVDDYFKNGVRKRKIPVGMGMQEVEVPTITGLCLHCGFESRQSFYDYENREGFSYIVKRARMFIECEYEELMRHGSTAAAIFALKNMGWKDKQELDLGNPDGSLGVPHTIQLVAKT